MNFTTLPTPNHHFDQVMASLLSKRLCVIAFSAVVFTASPANSDRIVLKDGGVEESDRIWETNHYIHFILKGTESVEIRYAKEIVDRIEREGKPDQRPTVGRPNSKPGKSKADEEPSVQQHLGRQTPSVLEQHPVVDPKMIKENRNVHFYDPRRSKRYWASRNSRHDTLRDAINALAKQYGRDSDWIVDHIGDENDLGAIHQRLVNAIGETTANEKINTEKIIPAMQKRQTEAPPRADSAPDLDVPKGIAFYDPRRPRKYWVDPDNRFDSLGDALNALAQTYKVPVSWIEEHLGPSNDLATIHEHIRNSLTHYHDRK